MIIYEEILRAFQKEKVKYILVGGIAVNLLGSFRTTADIDVLVEMTDKNLAKIVVILKKAGYHVKQPVDPMGIADKKTREDWIKNKNMKAFNFYKGDTSYNEVDIIIDSPVSYEDAKKDVIIMRINGVDLPVISFRKLIKMKQAAGRMQDKVDILELKRLMTAQKRDSK